MKNIYENYSECEKMSTVQNESQKIGEFLDWIGDEGYCLASYDEEVEQYYPANFSTERLLAKFFDIDLDKVEAERQDMLKRLQDEHKD